MSNGPTPHAICPRCVGSGVVADASPPPDPAKAERDAIVAFLRARVTKRNAAATSLADRFVATAVGGVVDVIVASIEKNEHHTEEP